MKEFDFYYDQKIKTWLRTHVTIKANSEEEAVEILKNDDGDGRVEVSYTERIIEVDENISLDDNDGYSTKEIYDSSANLIWENGINNLSAN